MYCSIKSKKYTESVIKAIDKRESIRYNKAEIALYQYLQA